MFFMKHVKLNLTCVLHCWWKWTRLVFKPCKHDPDKAISIKSYNSIGHLTKIVTNEGIEWIWCFVCFVQVTGFALISLCCKRYFDLATFLNFFSSSNFLPSRILSSNIMPSRISFYLQVAYFFMFKPIIAAHCQLNAATLNALRQCPGVSSRLECQPDASYKVSFGDPHFHAASSLRIPAFSRLSSLRSPHFSQHIPTKIWGECPPPPHPVMSSFIKDIGLRLQCNSSLWFKITR